jgi:beta-xylosidase/AraC-like DNA-binding protein
MTKQVGANGGFVMLEFEFLIQKMVEMHMHADIEFFYVMEGNVEFTMEDKRYAMNKEDFLVVNADKRHGYQTSKDFLGVSIHISYAELSKMLKQNMIFFWCNTVLEDNEVCDEVRLILKKIISEQFQNKGKDEIYLNSLYYEFLHVLTHDFLLNKDDKKYSVIEHKFDDRKHKIAEYIRLNYDKQISLNDLAQKLYLSNAYLSKYIKRQFGMSFIDYVNSVRLNYAVSQLLYSDKSVVRIAMDTGFASSAALNKTFKEKYGMTPTIYRGMRKNQEDKKHKTEEEEKTIQEQVAEYFKKNQQETKKDRKQPEEIITINQQIKEELYQNWNRMINIGAAADLLHSDVQQHVLYLKKQLHFEYVRFWDLYAPEMFLDVHVETNQYNFDKLDRVLDFLTKNDLKPYMELRVKPKKIIQNQDKILLYNEMSQFIDEPDKSESFLRQLIIHLINRYASENVEEWYFEIWKTETEQYLNQTNISDKSISVSLYLDRFAQMAGVLRKYLPNIKIGGGGFSLRYGEDNFREILEGWKARKIFPTFISIYNYPYTVDSIDKERNQTMDAEFVKNHLSRVREIMNEVEFPVHELHASEWNFSVSSRNVLNDHCMKGAYLINNMIDSIGIADIMGYWTGSDLYADYYDSKQLLNGSGGLLSKDGIPKPAFYAFEFMNRLGKYMRKRGEHYIVTDNGAGNWRIVCHNLKQLSYQYGLRREDEIALDDQNNLFTNMKKNKMHFELPALRDGRYLLRIYSVNQKHGSIQDEWMEMSIQGELNVDDIDYLGRITIPRMTMQSCQAQSGKMVFDITLEPNEIVFIHASYQYA